MRQRYVEILTMVLMAVAVFALVRQAQTWNQRPGPFVIPRGLPDHLMLGLSNHPDELSWMVESNTSWDARYYYMTGGVNTGASWANWLPNGQFATDYMEQSRRNGYLTVFTYYQLVKSLPMVGANEAEQDFTNLNNRQTMAAYYADFVLLLDKANEFGDPMIVHVEPDLWGYMQQRINGGEDAASIPAAVSSSGYKEVRGYADNLTGFGKALIHLRDVHAPNVILAVHASPWSTNLDVTTDPSPSLDVDSIAGRTARFLSATGNWDLVFVDLADRDAGYHEVIGNDRGAHWWDMSNQRYPNFARFADYLSDLSRGTGKRIVLWQVPIGNTVMRASNNTEGHYQDNRVQYFLGGAPTQLEEYARAGVIGILFGRGVPGPSTYSDAMKDGVTNPLPIGDNDQMSDVPDDDGGYLRARAQNYYAAGALALPKPVLPPQAPQFLRVLGVSLVLALILLLAARRVKMAVEGDALASKSS
ncbi:MAG: hypothetical protein EPO21_06795 [Chloroflexota bacterium]|nr:MAG: hypothetical protein EPO21_06795 [Chloroflexota bacterium]